MLLISIIILKYIIRILKNMNQEQKRKVRGLIVRLMAGEAREIYTKNRPLKRNRSYNQDQEVDIEGIKQELSRFIRDSNLVISLEAVKRCALKYLEDHEKFASANPSYGILKKQIERGEYDFSFLDDGARE